MKTSKEILFLSAYLIMVLGSAESIAQDVTSSYTYISISGRLMTPKLKVEVDLGETREQRIKGRKFSEILSEKSTHAAILNYMDENHFELVQAMENIIGGSASKTIFIMRKKKDIMQ